MNTWVGYHHMAYEGRGFKGAEYNKMMAWILNGLRIYAPFDQDVNNEIGNPNIDKK